MAAADAESEALVVGGTAAAILGCGEFGTVFAVSGDLVVKVFRRRMRRSVPLAEQSDCWVAIREVWESECAAYERLAGHPHLAKYVPGRFARVRVSDVLGVRGRSRASHYLLDCAYQMDRIPGIAVKYGGLDGMPGFEAIKDVVKAMEAVGIRESGDSSIFRPGKDASFTLIDFATRDAWAELYPRLKAGRGLPEHLRQGSPQSSAPT